MSAKSDYQTQQERITKLLMRLDEGMRKHDREFAGDPRNYGYPGDLQHVASLLEEASNFINQEGDEYGELMHADDMDQQAMYSDLRRGG